jgi:tetratricopeptide (TPR) repeat protein
MHDPTQSGKSIKSIHTLWTILWITLSILFLSTATPACTGAQGALEGSSSEGLLGGGLDGDFGATLAQAEAHWAKRDALDQLNAAIALYEKAVQTGTPDLSDEARRKAVGDVYARLARAYFMLGNGLLPLSVDNPEADDAKAAQSAAFDQGRQYAERALGLAYPALIESVKNGAELGDELAKFNDPAAAGLMFWWVTNLGRWLSFQGGLTALSYLDDLERVGLKAYELDPTFFYYATTSFLGGFFTRLPLPSGDAERAREGFEAAMAGAPEMLSHKVAFADLYATKIQDRALFERILGEVLAVDPATFPDDIAPENRVEQRRARRLLDRAGDLF